MMTGEYSVPRARAEIISSDLLDMTVTVLKTLSDPLRLQMLWALCDRDLTLSELAQLIGVSPTVAGQLLSRMRTAGVLQTEKSGRHVIYSMHDELSRQFIRQTLDFAAHRLELQGASDSTED
ncbi:winged helix-turn-helix transcriptional regulator [Glutamicibacter sp. FBE19]|nr:winged helix-turn-helix transcriptional regulator [Glutamicibacter sp. FBE19]NQD40149.1 winged helix-turn-helix transcriptional regulator [Glutamicibacter halophytocola]